MEKDYEKLKKRANYRWEFFQRNKSVQDMWILSKGNKKILWIEVAKYLSGVSEAHFGLSPIKIAYGGKKKDLVFEWFSYFEKDYFQKTNNFMKKYPKIKAHISFNAVDREDKTIVIKIHLDRKREDIIKGVEYLLNTLKKEAKYFSEDFKRPRPRWEEYDKYLKVYDLRKEGKGWRKIAHEVYPGDKSLDEGVRKVRLLHERALKMINGGWRQI
ncbi:MAG: hypothetical protein KG012_06515 [Deltaproteobacteria bacterium]|nr:hypothetical protein [Deltaproteobacteria bacterium]